MSSLGSILTSSLHSCSFRSTSSCPTFKWRSIFVLLFSTFFVVRRLPPLLVSIRFFAQASQYFLVDVFPKEYTFGYEVQRASSTSLSPIFWAWRLHGPHSYPARIVSVVSSLPSVSVKLSSDHILSLQRLSVIPFQSEQWWDSQPELLLVHSARP